VTYRLLSRELGENKAAPLAVQGLEGLSGFS